MRAVEQGIVTETTKRRLQELEAQIDEIKGCLAVEEAAEITQLTKSDIMRFILKTIRKEPRQLIRLLVKEIRLFDERIEIYYNYTDRKRPDEETRQAFCFYSENVDYDILDWSSKIKGEVMKKKVSLYI